MTLLGIFSSIEFYVIMAVIAAAIIAFAARPQTRGEVREYLLSSVLNSQEHQIDEAAPAIEFQCLDDGHVRLVRTGLKDVDMSGAVSIAATFDGMDFMIEERIVPGKLTTEPAHEAIFDIDFLPPGRYHVRYNSQSTGLFLAMQLHVKPGIVATRILSR